MLRRYCINLIIFVIPSIVTISFAQTNLSQLVKEIQPAVTTILTYDKNGKIIGQGSGFYINIDGDLITNFHVIENANC